MACVVLIGVGLTFVSAGVHTGTPAGIAPATDCALRHFAYSFGLKQLLFNSNTSSSLLAELSDALQLGACPGKANHYLPDRDATGTNGGIIWNAAQGHVWRAYVDVTHGNDTSAAGATVGLATSPRTDFKTIHAAVVASRSRPAGTAAEIVLKSGVHHLHSTINLSANDSNLTIVSGDVGDKDTTIISGGVALKTDWEPSARCKGCFQADLSGQGLQSIAGLRRNGIREIRARYPNFDPELDATIDGKRHFHDGQDGQVCQFLFTHPPRGRC